MDGGNPNDVPASNCKGAAYASTDGQHTTEGQHKKRGRLEKLRHNSVDKLERLRRANKTVFGSFLLLGMGMGAYNAAVLQSTDYLNLQYKAMHITRLHLTFYTLGFLIMTVKYFFKGPPDKSERPRQRARLMQGYAVTLIALVVPVLVDGVVHNFTWPGQVPAYRLNAIVSCWVVGALVAGGCEGVISTVIFGEAAAVKADRAAAYGKVLVSLLMPALRCFTKAILPAQLGNTSPDNMAAMRFSSTVHIIVAAVLVIVCLLVTWVIPWQVAQVQAIEPQKVPPALTLQTTLATAMAAEENSPEGEEARESMHAVGTLAAMVPTADATFAQPLFHIGNAGGSWGISLVPSHSDTCGTNSTPLAAANGSSGMQLGSADGQPTLKHFMDNHRVSLARRGSAASVQVHRQLGSAASVQSSLNPKSASGALHTAHSGLVGGSSSQATPFCSF